MLDDTAMIVEEVTAVGCPELAATLAAAGLPVDDLAEPGRRFFQFWTPDGARIGFIGAEPCEPGAVLLRSLVVVPGQRRQGWSPAMIDWLLAGLAAAGITDVWLLTTTIVEWARRLGFAPVPRDRAPAGLRASRQFASLCPASAVLMHRRVP